MEDRRRGEWHKSSYSNGGGGNCVEVSCAPEAVRVRDSKDPEGPVLTFSPTHWREFVRTLRGGPEVFRQE
ncbi:DUF397 domain-containing protein [Streptomyces sp. NPDC004031]